MSAYVMDEDEYRDKITKDRERPTLTAEYVRTEYRVTPKIEYKYNEGKALQEITAYIDKTYGEHYSQGNIQSTEIAIDRGRGLHFCLGNVDKYSGRYGLKGTPEDWRKDLMKVIHYAIIALHVHDLEHNKDT